MKRILLFSTLIAAITTAGVAWAFGINTKEIDHDRENTKNMQLLVQLMQENNANQKQLIAMEQANATRDTKYQQDVIAMFKVVAAGLPARPVTNPQPATPPAVRTMMPPANLPR